MKSCFVAFVCLFVCLPCSAFASDEKPKAHVYTNDDLKRVSERKGETGVDSTPDASPRPLTETPAGAARQEALWRRQAEQLRRRLYPLKERAAEIEGRIEARRKRPGVQPYSDPEVRAAEARLAALRQRIADEESRFEERARRAGAQPEWLR